MQYILNICFYFITFIWYSLEPVNSVISKFSSCLQLLHWACLLLAIVHIGMISTRVNIYKKESITQSSTIVCTYSLLTITSKTETTVTDKDKYFYKTWKMTELRVQVTVYRILLLLISNLLVVPLLILYRYHTGSINPLKYSLIIIG